MTTTRQQYKSATNAAGVAAGQADQEYQRRMREFDPYAAAERSAMGQFNTFRQMLNRDISELRGEQTGMGRLNTGWAQQGEDELVGDSADRLNNQIMSNANHAASMDLSRIGQMGQYGLARSGQFYDLLSGEMDRKQAEENARRSRRASLFGVGGALLGAGAGALLGNPVLGAQLGGSLGASVGGGY